MSLESSPSALSMLLPDHPADGDIKEERGKSLGVKSIGPWLSFIFVINQIYGPGVLAIPIVYEQSGILPTLLMVTFFLVVSSLAATCLSQAIASIPDNRQYQQRVEFGTAVEYYYGHKWHYIFQICLNITVQAYNIASVVICAQSLDQFFVAIAGKTFAFEFGPDFGFHSYDNTDALYLSTRICFSLGYGLITLFFMPAGFLNLNDNVKTVQVGSFIFLIILFLEFIGFFFWRGAHDGYHYVPAFGSTYTQLVSVFIFSWAYVIFIPSWLNEKSVDTSVNKVIWGSGIASWVGYVMIGILCAYVFTQDEIGSDDMLFVLSRPTMPILTRITSHLFALGVIAPGIPVCSVTTRYNLYVGGVCSKKWSYFWGCVAPWIVGFIFCQGKIFADLLNWTSLLFNGLVNFIVPFLMYLTSLKIAQVGGAPVGTHVLPGAVKEALSAAEARSDDTDAVEAELERERLQALASSYGAHVVPASSVNADGNTPLLTESSHDIRMYGEEPASPSAVLTNGHDHIALGVGARSSDDSSGAITFCSGKQDPSYSHGPVYPLPESLRAHAYHIVMGLLIATQLVITVQIGVDLYYAAIGQDQLGGGGGDSSSSSTAPSSSSSSTGAWSG